METITGEVTAILFPKRGQAQPDNGYAIINVRPDGKSDTVGVKGSMPGVHEGANVRISGEWKIDKWGRTLVAKTYEETMPESVSGIEKYLASGLIKGIGPATAKRIVKTFGADTLSVIDNTPERLGEVPGLNRKKVDAILEQWAEQAGVRKVMVFLKEYDVGNAVAAKIYKKYRDSSISVVKDNPYVLADEIDGVGFLTADKIATSMGMSSSAPERIMSALVYVLKENAERGGNVFCLAPDLVAGCRELLNRDDEDGMVADRNIYDAIGMLAEKKSVVLDGQDSEMVYLPTYYYSEKNAAQKLTLLLQQSNVLSKPIDFQKIEKECNVTFDDVQKQAITLAAVSHVCVITGGPGTGKTTTMRGVIGQARQSGQKVILAAPTGRAAKRLAETTEMSASTIHRLLEYSPGGGFNRNAENPLAGDLLVVDESSMIDILLFNALLKAVPQAMRLVLVGDVDQLPSVGAGNTLKDVIDSGCVPVVRLTRIFRQAQGSTIVRNAHAVNTGHAPSLPKRLSPDGEDFCFVERDPAVLEQRGQNATELIQKDILTLVPKFIPETFGYKLTDIQVLSPMRRGPLGTDELNRLLQNAVNPSERCIRRGLTEFRKGDRVIQMKNNYEWDVYNGDIGTVLEIDTEDRSMIISFDDKTVLAKGEDLDTLDLAYACTIHKSQGSEYKCVVIPVTMGHYVMLTRNLLYTAITRAKKHCILVGDKKAIMTMVNTNNVAKRNSALVDRLKQYSR